ncbi:MAG: hypothetical protein ACR2NU_06280 [Aeoliella sp.]
MRRNLFLFGEQTDGSTKTILVDGFNGTADTIEVGEASMMNAK